MAELYANAWGVERNTQLALALSCHASDVPMELIDIVATLSKPKTESDYLFCDHTTSGMSTGYCTAQKQQYAQSQRDQAYQNLSKNWSAVDKQLFKAFLHQADVLGLKRQRSFQNVILAKQPSRQCLQHGILGHGVAALMELEIVQRLRVSADGRVVGLCNVFAPET